MTNEINEEYLDNIEIDGLDESFAQNADVEDVELALVTIVDFMIDGSGSMSTYETIMHDCLVHYKKSIEESKQVDEMLVSKTVFNGTIQAGGRVFASDLNTDYSACGTTRLYDAIVDERQRLLSYIEQLDNNGTKAIGSVVILSDGEDIGSTCNIGDAKKAIKDLLQKEIRVAFIAFGSEAFNIADQLGIPKKNVMKVTNDESELRRVIDLTSKSARSLSKKVSTGVGVDNDDGGFFDV